MAVLADGMGGHAGGALASSTACQTFLRAYETSSGDVTARLDEALQLANLAIAQCVEEDPLLNGMGCTLVGTVFGPAGLEWVSVGDSPLFRLREGEITLLNTDHSLAPELDKMAAEGKITLAQAKGDPRRHFLRSALTGTEIDMVDRSHHADRSRRRVQAGDVIILASDGIQTLSPEDILQVVTDSAAAGPEQVADALLEAVEAAKDTYQDNTTVVVVSVTGD